MKALVTGASGFVGYSVAQLLADKGFSVKILMRQQSPDKYIAELPVEICRGDLLDKDSLVSSLSECDYLFHVAAHYSLWEKDNSIFYRVNVDGTKNLFEIAQQQGVKRIVYTSSVATLKLAADRSPVDETSTATDTDMIGPYKHSKFVAENMVREMAANGLPVVLVSPSTPIGPYDVKPTPTGKIILDFLRGKMPAYVDTGLNFVAVEDVAAGHLLALEKGTIGETYILGGENLRLIEMLEILARLSGRKAPRMRMPYWVAHTAGACSEAWAKITGKTPAVPLNGVRMSRKYMFFDSSKAVRELGYRITSVEGALKRAADWFAANGYL